MGTLRGIIAARLTGRDATLTEVIHRSKRQKEYLTKLIFLDTFMMCHLAKLPANIVEKSEGGRRMAVQTS